MSLVEGGSFLEDLNGNQTVDINGNQIVAGVPQDDQQGDFTPPHINAVNHFHGLQSKRINQQVIIVMDHDAYIDKGSPDANHGSDVSLSIYDDPNEQTIILFRQSDISDYLPAADSLDHAFLHIRRPFALGVGQRFNVTLWRITSSWTEDGVTWNTQPTMVEIRSVIGAEITENSWYSFDITNLFQNWLDGTWDNYGIALSGGRDLGVVGFRSTEYSVDETLRPYFELFFWPFD